MRWLARNPEGSSTHTSALFGLLLAVVAAVAAMLVVRGPAVPERAEVLWPDPTAVPSASEPSADAPAEWYSPLLLSGHRPERLVVHLPCRVAPGQGALFATTRSADDGTRLAVTSADERLQVALGQQLLTEVPWPAGAHGCEATLVFESGSWTLARDGAVLAAGEASAPLLSGFFTGVAPTASSAVVRAELTTAAAASHPSPRQWVFTVVSVVAACGALVVVARRRPKRALSRPSRLRLHPVDGVVVASIVAWGFAGPWFFDDGWLIATVRGREASGSFNNYYDTLATQMPLGFAHHMLLSPFAALDVPFVWWRLVPIVACLGTWALLRRAAGMVLGEPVPSVGIAALATSFMVFVGAFAMTLRPEPVVALLSAAVLVGVLDYRSSLSRRSIAVAVLGAAVAATLHPSGIVAAAPLVVAVPALWSDVRRGTVACLELASLALVGCVTGVLLLFADTDVGRWRDARQLFSGDGFHSYGITDEGVRYRDLLTNGTTPAIAGVLFGALALASFGAVRAGEWVTARRRADGSSRRPDARFDIAPLSLVVAIGLLSAAPSKWVYHFGSAAAIVVLAVAVETVRVARAKGTVGVVCRAGVVIGAALVTARALRDPHDAQYFFRLDSPEADSGLFRVLGNPLVWLVLAGALLLVTMRYARRRAAELATSDGGASSGGAWAIPGGLGVVAALTAVTFALVPWVRGPHWSMARVNALDAFDGDCGFPDRIEVNDPSEAVVLPAGPGLEAATLLDAGDASGAATERPALPPDWPATTVFGTDATAAGDVVTPWYSLESSGDGDVLVAVSGDVGGPASSLEVQWSGPTGEAGIVATETLVSRTAAPSIYGEVQPWRVLRLSIPEDATPSPAMLRFVAHGDATGDGGAVLVTGPIRVPARRLASYLDQATVLVSPPQVPLLWCAEPPPIRDGIATMPDVVVGFEFRPDRSVVDTIPELGSPSGPWYLAEDAYAVRRVWGWLDDRSAASFFLRVPDGRGSLLPVHVERR